MTKTECLNKAAAARHAAKLATARYAVYANTFGGGDKLTQDALLAVDVANEVAAKWERIAEWNPMTRKAALRKGTLPAYLFGY